jgi:hypothetical protein
MLFFYIFPLNLLKMELQSKNIFLDLKNLKI